MREQLTLAHPRLPSQPTLKPSSFSGGLPRAGEPSHAPHPHSQGPRSEGVVRLHQWQPQDCHSQTHQRNTGRGPAFLPCAAPRALVCVCVTGGGRQSLSLWGLPSPAPVPLSVRRPGQFCHPHVRPCDSQIHPDPSSCWMEGPCQALEERPATGSCVSLAGRAGGLNQEDAAHQSCPELGPTVCQHDARGPGSPH